MIPGERIIHIYEMVQRINSYSHEKYQLIKDNPEDYTWAFIAVDSSRFLVWITDKKGRRTFIHEYDKLGLCDESENDPGLQMAEEYLTGITEILGGEE